ncbi:hypothetical protein ACIBL3_39670 [Kribbella sp. NPDC050124]|uniref:hypothetical protein n=1 Tax=Kribbella sp. NPDC050124 TaxID=3364114 RepID=UPI0037BA2DC4
MFATLRLNTYDPEKLAAANQMAEFDRVHAAQPGFEGSVSIDLGQGRRFVVNLWETRRPSGRDSRCS